MIDKRDWGYFDRESGRPRFAHTAEQLQSGPRVRQAMNRHLVQSHRDGRDRIYYTSRRNSGFCLAMIDIDQHDGQTDGLDLVLFLVTAYFPDAFFEASRRGFHLYVPFRCKMVGRDKMNALLQWLCDSLRTIAAGSGFASTIDVTGGFGQPGNLDKATGEISYRHGKLAALPNPQSDAALDWLINAPIHLVSSIFAIGLEAGSYTECTEQDEGGQKEIEGDYAILGNPPAAYADTFTSMHQVCQWMIRVTGQLPDGSELLQKYCELSGKSGHGSGRVELAERIASRYRARHNPDALTGFQHNRARLLGLIAQHVTDWSLEAKVQRKIRKLTPEDLAIALYLTEQVSFTPCEDPLKQFGMPYDRVKAFFRALVNRGVIKKGRKEDREVWALLDVLSRSSLIECMHKKFRFGGPRGGIGRKWTIGKAHPRYLEHMAFRQSVKIQFVGAKVAKDDQVRVAA